MTTHDFDAFCRLVQERSGIVLNEDKRYLVDTRLSPIAQGEGLASVDELLMRLHLHPGEALIARCVEAMATHESSFFRDTIPFLQLSQVIIPRIIESKGTGRSLRIWSAACATGQEPYSIAMTLQEHAAALAGWHIEILATDFVPSAVEHARIGRFTEFEIGRGLRPEQLQRWFHRADDCYEINPELRRHITFRTHNLLDGLFGFGHFDIVFCRNVLIYFSREMKIDMLNRLSSVLNNNGALILGSAETVIGLCDAFEPTPGQRGLFRHNSHPEIVHHHAALS